MHFLDQPSLLQLARCDRFTLACADSPFAWREIYPRTFVCSSVVQVEADCARWMGSLLRHCNVSMSFESWNPDFTIKVLATACSILRLRALDARYCREAILAAILLKHVPPSSLTELQITCEPQMSGMLRAVLKQQPCIHTFFCNLQNVDDSVSCDFLAADVLPALSHLSVRYPSDAHLATVTSCNPLHSFVVRACQFPPLIQLLCSQNMRQLKSLPLWDVLTYDSN
jgi:hypothetical protein